MLCWLPTLPLTDPIPIFLLVLLIILCAPMLNRVRIPHIVGLILAGIVLGPNGLNVLANDASFDLFGKVGILYIMFLAGLEIDLNTFRRNSTKGFVFGLYTFAIPMLLGTLSGVYLLHFDWVTSVLLASMYASHTLIAYPIVSKMGVAKSRSVSIAVAGTIVTVTASLFILAVIVALHNGSSGVWYWVRFGVANLLVGAVIFGIFPKVARWFLGRFGDSVAQYIFVLAMVFVASLLADVVGMEGILGAFFAGLVLNRLIPGVSPLMNRIEFVGNAIFIPFFLISIGMLIDVQAFFVSPQALLVAAVMSVVATFSKWLAAWLTERTCRLGRTEGRLLFGLSNGQAAATLAAVMIGYNLGLLNDDVLNGTIVMILVTCTISSLVTERAARRLAADELSAEHVAHDAAGERILIPMSYAETMPQLIDVANLLKSPHNKNALFAVNVHGEDTDGASGQRLLERAAALAAASDNKLTLISKTGVNVANTLAECIAEYDISDVLVNIHKKTSFVDTFLGNKIERLLHESRQNIFVCSSQNPVNTIKRLVVVVPDKAELEEGFALWFDRVKNIVLNLGVPLLFFANADTTAALKTQCARFKNLHVKYNELASWEDFLIVTKAVRPHDSVMIVTARKGTLSYNPLFEKLPYYLTKYFAQNNFALIFPRQTISTEKTGELFNPLHV